MKAGIFFPGLGQSYSQESVIKYAKRLMHEMDLNHASRQVKFALKPEKIIFIDDIEINTVSIIEKDAAKEKVVYKLYEFNYGTYLTERFLNYNILIKSFLLFTLVIKKLPMIVRNIFRKSPYQRNMQSLYVFSLFLIIASSILFLIPAAFEVFFKFLDSTPVRNIVESRFYVEYLKPVANSIGLNKSNLEEFSKFFVTLTTLILVLVPKAKNFVTTLATEFVCAHNYLDNGQQSQKILGMLDQLVEFIAEREEPGIKLHYHAYSFGSIIALDHLYPYGNIHSESIKKSAEGIITIGTPFEFINAYYPRYFEKRDASLDKSLTWLNVYSLADALASNFRFDNLVGEAEYGMALEGNKPVNINYEITKPRHFNVLDFITLNSLRAHGIYWDPDVNGQSCIRSIYKSLVEAKILFNAIDLSTSTVTEALEIPAPTPN